MSDSEESYESAKDNDVKEDQNEGTSDDEPLAKKNKSPNKKSASPGKKSKNSPKKSNENKRGRKSNGKKKGRVSFALVPTEKSEKVEEEYEVNY